LKKIRDRHGDEVESCRASTDAERHNLAAIHHETAEAHHTGKNNDAPDHASALAARSIRVAV
jgi:hypothetical protein